MSTITEVRDGVGVSVRRPDGIPKVKGEFAYSSDMWAEDMLWGATLRSPHPRARIRAIETRRRAGGPGRARRADPRGRARAARPTGSSTTTSPCWRSPRSATRASRWRSSPPTIPRPRAARPTGSRSTTRSSSRSSIPSSRSIARLAAAAPRRATCCATSTSRTATEPGEADVVVSGEYEVGMQDQAFLGPESGLAVPAEDGGVDLFIATQWLHVDRDQVAACLDLPVEKVRFTLAGVGGAFGGREDVSMQIHACLLALHTGRPVKMVYGREESFFGHVHRHPARMRYEHGATRDGRLRVHQGADPARRRRVRVLVDARSCSNAASFALGPVRGAERADRRLRRLHRQPAVRRDARVRRRADVLRARGADGQARRGAGHGPGRAAAAQRDDHRHLDADRRADQLPRAGRRAAASSVRDAAAARAATAAFRAGSRTSPAARAWCAASATPSGFKNVGFSEGFDDYSTARVRLSVAGGEPLVEVHTAAAEVGQGLVTVMGQIARTELGVENVLVLPADTQVGSAGLLVGLAPDPHDRRRGAGGVPRGARGAGERRGGAIGDGDRGDPRVPPPPDAAARRARPGRRARDVRVRRAPGGRRRRRRARARAGGRDRDRAGRRQGDEPAGRRGPDRGRHRPGPRAGADGGDPGRRRPGAQRVVHRLPDPDRARHAAGRARRARARRPRLAVRAARDRRAADDLLDARGRRRAARRDRAAR